MKKVTVSGVIVVLLMTAMVNAADRNNRYGVGFIIPGILQGQYDIRDASPLPEDSLQYAYERMMSEWAAALATAEVERAQSGAARLDIIVPSRRAAKRARKRMEAGWEWREKKTQ